ncbi:MAG: hypothetical protein AAGG75_13195 [Bacteroidota bacterium]
MKGLKSYFSGITPALFEHISGKPREFIDQFRAHNFLTEEAFKEHICEGKHNDSYYRKRKANAVKIMQVLFLISNAKGGSLVKKKYDECQKKLTVAHKFISEGARVEGIRLVKDAHKIAVEYDFSYLACELSSILHRYHAYYSRNIKSVQHYAGQVQKYLDNYTAEKQGEFYFNQIIVDQARSIVREDFLLEAIQQLSKQKGESVRFTFIKASINVLYRLYTGEYIELIANCTTALRFFATQEGAYPSYHFFLLYNQGIAQTAIGAYTKAEESYQSAELYTENKPFNHSILQYYKTLNALHAGQYPLAYELYQQNKRCKIDDIRAQFAIIEAYLCFLSHTGYLKLDKIFRMGKYLNETFGAQEDKQGSKINILIAELLVYLARDRGKFIDRIEAVKDYSYRHLKSSDTRRAKWFIKILCLLPHRQVSFHPVALQRKAKRYIELLKSHPVRMGEGFAVEIIPFEQLLEMIALQLKKRVA